MSEKGLRLGNQVLSVGCTNAGVECSTTSKVDQSELESTAVSTCNRERIRLRNHTLDKDGRLSRFPILLHRNLYTCDVSRRLQPEQR